MDSLSPNSPQRKPRTAWNKGIPMSDEQKANLSVKGKGRVPPNKGKKGKPAWNKGKTSSIETRAKQSLARMGKAPANKGVPMSQAQKDAVSLAQTGRKQTPEHIAKRVAGVNRAHAERGSDFLTPQGRAKMSAVHKNKIVSDATRKKQADAKTGKVGNRLGTHQPPNVSESSRRSALAHWEGMNDEQKAAKLEILRNATKDITKSKLEEVVASELDAQGVVYERQAKIGWYRVDFYIPSTNTVIEAYGCYWHCCEPCNYTKEGYEKKREADVKRNEYLLRKGYNLKIIWEHERKPELRRMRRKAS